MRKVLLVVPIFSVLALFGGLSLTTPTSAERTVDDLSPIVVPIQQVNQADYSATVADSVAQSLPEIATPVAPIPVIVEVAKGDTLSSIAEAHQLTYARLFDANPEITSPNVINPGQKIRVPLADEQLVSRAMPKEVYSSPSLRTTPVQGSNAPAVADGSVWDQLARCESGGNWAINTGNGYYGGLQFSLSTWRAVGGSGLPSENSREEQIVRAEILLARSGWGQWPACTTKLGLR